jgi:hypothetical protein
MARLLHGIADLEVIDQETRRYVSG